MEYREKRDELQGIVEIQKYFRGHQARCYYHDLKTGILALQSCNSFLFHFLFFMIIFPTIPFTVDHVGFQYYISSK